MCIHRSTHILNSGLPRYDVELPGFLQFPVDDKQFPARKIIIKVNKWCRWRQFFTTQTNAAPTSTDIYDGCTLDMFIKISDVCKNKIKRELAGA